MKDFRWYFNRLRAMSIPEVRWRLEQKQVARAERKVFGKRQVKVTEKVFYRSKEDLAFHGEKLPVAENRHEDECGENRTQNNGNPDNKAQTDNYHRNKTILSNTIALLGGYRYEDYKMEWHAGFQTQQKWPLIFSYDLDYKQRDDIGDARTNWELNRHFQFALLACNYYRTGDIKYVTELSELFVDWNEKNPFLYGISWTSVMEVAIRDLNWIYALGFLTGAAQDTTALCKQLRIGIINMTHYISHHYSRYSSANNHVIIEAVAMGLAGIVMDCQEWLETAIAILRTEMPRQNYEDGVNKEVSLHYQSFFMEAVGLLILAMQKNEISIPQNWRNLLVKMSRYLADCQGNYGETVVFGDDDEGKILDLEGESCNNKRNHYQYVLQLMSLILPERYVEKVSDQTLSCLVSAEQIEKVFGKPYYHNQKSICYPEGGVSILRSEDGRALIGIDHGPLGFGSIAAHGHADALSFQMYLDGEAVFADAGTYIYHMDLENRNAFRKTENHNTVTVNGKDQSEMLGAFLWGKRAEVKLLGHNLPDAMSENSTDGKENKRIKGRKAKNYKAEGTESTPLDTMLYLTAGQNGYTPYVHERTFEFYRENYFKIYDSLLHIKGETAFTVNFLIGNGCRLTEKTAGTYEIITEKNNKIGMEIIGKVNCTVSENGWVSDRYGKKQRAYRIKADGKTETDIVIVTIIGWENA